MCVQVRRDGYCVFSIKTAIVEIGIQTHRQIARKTNSFTIYRVAGIFNVGV